MVSILGANSASSVSYEISNSLRFNQGDSPVLSKTPSSSGNQKTMTFSFWIKRSHLSDEFYFFYSAGQDANNRDGIRFYNNSLDLIIQRNDYDYYRLLTTAKFRDVSAWYHIVIAIDTTDSTSSNRFKMYVNGSQITDFQTETYPTQNLDLYFNENSAQYIGRFFSSDSNHYDGYIAEWNFIDGSQKAPTDFGKFNDNNVWIPKKYSGSYGTNGFFLEFKQTGTSQNASGIGADTSGNDNHFAVTNLAATDVTTDTCTNNFCTLNPLSAGSDIRANGSFLEGNTELINGGTSGQSSNQRCQGTMGFTNGKWYWEAKLVSNTMTVGIIDSDVQTSGSVNFSGLNTARYDSETGNVTNSGGTVYTGSTYDNGDIIGIAVDADNGYVYFAKNGTYQNSGDPTSGSSGTGGASITLGNFILPLISDNSSGSAGRHQHNFGNPPYAVSSSNTDGKYGNFEYAPPSGYYALCTKNLAEFG